MRLDDATGEMYGCVNVGGGKFRLGAVRNGGGWLGRDMVWASDLESAFSVIDRSGSRSCAWGYWDDINLGSGGWNTLVIGVGITLGGGMRLVGDGGKTVVVGSSGDVGVVLEDIFQLEKSSFRLDMTLSWAT